VCSYPNSRIFGKNKFGKLESTAGSTSSNEYDLFSGILLVEVQVLNSADLPTFFDRSCKSFSVKGGGGGKSSLRVLIRSPQGSAILGQKNPESDRCKENSWNKSCSLENSKVIGKG